MKTIADKPWKLVRYCLFLIAILLTVYFGIFDYFKPPFELSSTFRGPSDRNIHIIALATMTLVLMIGQKKQIAVFSCFHADVRSRSRSDAGFYSQQNCLFK